MKGPPASNTIPPRWKASRTYLSRTLICLCQNCFFLFLSYSIVNANSIFSSSSQQQCWNCFQLPLCSPLQHHYNFRANSVSSTYKYIYISILVTTQHLCLHSESPLCLELWQFPSGFPVFAFASLPSLSRWSFKIIIQIISSFNENQDISFESIQLPNGPYWICLSILTTFFDFTFYSCI